MHKVLPSTSLLWDMIYCYTLPASPQSEDFSALSLSINPGYVGCPLQYIHHVFFASQIRRPTEKKKKKRRPTVCSDLAFAFDLVKDCKTLGARDMTTSSWYHQGLVQIERVRQVRGGWGHVVYGLLYQV